MATEIIKEVQKIYITKKQIWISAFALTLITIITLIVSSLYSKKLLCIFGLVNKQEIQRSKIKYTNLILQAEKKIRAEYDERLKKEIEAQAKTNTQERSETALNTLSDVKKLRSDILFESKINTLKGLTAHEERSLKNSYKAKYEITVKLPSAACTLSELEAVNPQLSAILPSLPTLLRTATVSPWYSAIYNNKIQRIRKDARSLSSLITKHNLYDCQTILHLDAVNGRKIFMMQAEMDVVSDGSDGDRLPQMPEEIVNSTHYQPFTSYGWQKQTKTINPMIAGLRKRIAMGLEELNHSNTKDDRKKWLNDRIKLLENSIADLEARSYLIAEYDPFIVIPVNLLTASSDAYAPKVGDYAVVIYENNLYPCIVGDGGPTYKVGEGSLRLAKQINSKASPYNRPVSDLKVTYLVFPGSREKKAKAPNYSEWRIKCDILLKEIGGLGSGYSLYEWTDLLPKNDGFESSDSSISK